MASDKSEATTECGAVPSVRLPAFWKRAPEYWFNHAEAVFTTSRITSNTSRVNHVIGALDEEGVRTVGDLLGPSCDYQAIRDRLVSAYGLPRATRFRETVRPGGLGNRRPSQLLRDMRTALPDGIGEDALKEYWLRKLPGDILPIVSSLDLPLDALATRADRILDPSTPRSIDAVNEEDIFATLAGAISSLAETVKEFTARVNASQPVYQRRTTVIAAQPPAATPVATATGACYYHTRYGAQSRNCRPPCSYKPQPRHDDPVPFPEN